MAPVLAACTGPRIVGDDDQRNSVPVPPSPAPAAVDRKHDRSVDQGANGRPARDPVAEAERDERIRRLLGQDAPPRGKTLDGGARQHGDAGVPPIPNAEGGNAGPLPRFERFELVTAEASIPIGAGGPAGNSWGGHQTRVLRMRDGEVYTAYLTAGATSDSNQWHLARRHAAGWQRVASGAAWREPVNILRTPEDGIALVAWPKGAPVLTTFGFANGSITRRETQIPGEWEATPWVYGAAGIGLDGTLCTLQSTMGLAPSAFLWACRHSPDGTWEFRRTLLAYRHCYTYILPQGRGLTLVSTRDVLYSTLQYARPPGAFEFVFNEITAYGTADRATGNLVPTLVREELPTPRYPEPVTGAQIDAYLDTEGRLHVLYTLAGQSTAGVRQSRHALLVNGRVIADVALPEEGYWRITQDSAGRFWALVGTGTRFAVYPALAADGLRLGRPTVLDLGAEQVRYSGIAIAAPRAGVSLDDIVDGGFPSGRSGERWVYFRLRLQ